MKFAILLTILLNANYLVESRESCLLYDGKTIGECMPKTNCSVVWKKSHNICGNKRIVCCPLPPFKIDRNIACSTEKVHQKKCREYSTKIKPNPRSKCLIKTSGFISGGTEAAPKEFPHMALLGFDEGNFDLSWKCGGTLISDRFVLTAAHCIITQNPLHSVRLGELNYNSNTDIAAPEDFGYDALIPHPQYNKLKKYNDIGLIKLDRTVEFNSFIYPACLPLTFDLPAQHNIATGWGSTGTGAFSSHLLKVALNTYPTDECQSDYKRIDYDDELNDSIQFCAGSRDDNKDTCGGDSGGPLQIYHSCEDLCMYTVTGITSFGPPCGRKLPATYARVYPYINWIEKTIW